MKNLRHCTLQEIQLLMAEHNQPSYKAKQVYEWIWKKGIHRIEQMTTLSKELRDKLSNEYTLNTVEIHHTQYSSDGTIKNRFVLHDGNFIEGVLIPTPTRVTACISSQVGCSLTCKFCATGYLERKRNVHFNELYDQVFLLNQQANKHFGKSLTNIVYMGMGEPLLNYTEIIKSIEKITSPEGLGMSPSRITVSTAGIAKMIKKLADDNVRFNLAVSLHAATDTKRNEIMPINETNNLKTLIEALTYFYNITKSPITFEYILFNQFNDSEQDANDLIKICRQVPSKVNIIEYNTIQHARFTKPNAAQMELFMNYLAKHKINARLRRSRGKDIDAACGQLANVNQTT